MKRSRPLKREFSVTQNPLEMRDKAGSRRQEMRKNGATAFIGISPGKASLGQGEHFRIG